MSPYFLHLNNYKIETLSCFVSFFASCSIVGSLLLLLGALYPLKNYFSDYHYDTKLV